MPRSQIQRFDRRGREIDPDENGGVLRDSERLRIPMFMADSGTVNPDLDPVQRATALDQQTRLTDGSGDPQALHRPGQRFLVGDASFDDARREVERAYERRALR